MIVDLMPMKVPSVYLRPEGQTYFALCTASSVGVKNRMNDHCKPRRAENNDHKRA